MVNKKVMLAKSVSNVQPEAGYWPAKLTIGYSNKFGTYYGYMNNPAFGRLEPTKNIASIFTLSASEGDPTATSVEAHSMNGKDLSFYYKNQKYTKEAGQKAFALYNEWKSLVGQTVDVWIERGGKTLLAQVIRYFMQRPVLC